MATREEEQVILQQFLRFGETKSIAQEIILQDVRENRDKHSLSTPKTESEIKKFIERSNIGMQSFMRGYDPRHLLGRSLYAAATNLTTNLTSPSTPLLSPALLSSYAASTNRDTPISLTTSSNPAPTEPPAGSPLSRLQTMQPFDYRRERFSPTVSPINSEKCGTAAPSVAESLSPQNLSTGAASSSQPSPVTKPEPVPLALSLKVETKEEKPVPPVTLQMTPTSVSRPEPEVKEDTSSNEGVINYSTKDTSKPITSTPTPSLYYAEQKIKHLRKSTHPTKRPWQPTPGYGGTLISPSGKKRVLCTACNKTFCDKGALKIHYSAVHLKEMHKCSVDGCNMMFSSRRSRNRHSANPNPKLHMPQARRKLPDGMGMMDEKLSPSSSLSSSPPGMIPLPQSLSISSMSPMSLENKSVIARPSSLSTSHSAIIMHPGAGYYLDPRHMLSPGSTPEKMPRLDSHYLEHVSADSRPQEEAESRSRKRKSLVPTRCSQTDQMFLMSDDNSDDGISFEDSSSEVEGLMMEDRSPCSDFESMDTSSPKDMHSDGESIGVEYLPRPSLQMSNSVQIQPTDLRREQPGSHMFDEIKESPIKQMDLSSRVKLQDECGDVTVEDSEPTPVVVVAPEQDMSVDTSDTKCITNGIEPKDLSTRSDEGENGNGDCSMDRLSIDQSHDSDGECEPDENGHMSSDLDMNGEDENGDRRDDDLSDIPVDEENPRRCSSCGKVFQNLFTVKTHYQNVHLKLMHKCTVEGCNAAFPSKRSRDRHSSNLNLHRKLLSTSSGNESDKVSSHNLLGQSLRDEFVPRIYENQPYHLGYSHQSRYDTDGVDDIDPLSPPQRESSPPPAYATRSATNNNNDTTSNHNSEEAGTGYTSDNDNSGDDTPQPDPDGTVTCHVCHHPFRDNLVLKEHFEKLHPKEMFHCTITGCDKIFSTRKSRNRHSQNDNLHRHLSQPKINGTA